jgi:tRNA1Val (adenine37-N6)-methyltransferase
MRKLELFQSPTGYRYSIDPFLLVDFINPGNEDKIIDFGTGNGIVPLLLARKSPSKIIGLEIQTSLLKHARRNILQRGLGKKITLIQGDIRQSQKIFKGSSFNIVVSNPPYRKLNSGRINPNQEKAIARHEILITLSELIDNAANLLCDKGRLVMIFVFERYNELLTEMKQKGLVSKKIRFVCSTSKSSPKMVLVESIKNGGGDPIVEDPIVIYDSNGNYSLEMKEIYDSFNNHWWTNSSREIGKSRPARKEAEKRDN